MPIRAEDFISNLLEGFAGGVVTDLTQKRNKQLDDEKRQNEFIAGLLIANPDMAGAFNSETLAKLGVTPDIQSGLIETGQLKRRRLDLEDQQRQAQLKDARNKAQTSALQLSAERQRQEAISALSPEDRAAELTPGVVAARQAERKLTNEEVRQQRQDRLTEAQLQLATLQAQHANAKDARDATRLENEIEFQKLRLRHEETRLNLDETRIKATEEGDKRKERTANNKAKIEYQGLILNAKRQQDGIIKENIASHKGKINRPAYETKEAALNDASRLNDLLEFQNSVENSLAELSGKEGVLRKREYVAVEAPKELLKGVKFIIEERNIAVDGKSSTTAPLEKTGSSVLDDLVNKAKGGATSNASKPTASPSVSDAPQEKTPIAKENKPSAAVITKQDRASYADELGQIDKARNASILAKTRYVYLRSREGKSIEEAAAIAFGEK